MAIGTALAVGLGAAALGAGASVAAASKNSKAINQATQAQTDSNAQSVALQKDIYGQNKATLSPFIVRGNAAGNALQDMLGLGGNNQSTPTPQVNALYNGGYGTAAQFQGAGGNPFAFDPGSPSGVLGNRYALPQGQQSFQALPAQASGPQSVNGRDAFGNYIANSDYGFQFGQGANAINSGYAGAGTLQSGAAMKELEGYRQNLQAGYRNEFMGYLGQQQGVGLSAAGAQAGVGIDYANNVSNLNSQNANALANAAVAKANNSNALIGGITGAVGNIAGYFGGR